MTQEQKDARRAARDKKKELDRMIHGMATNLERIKNRRIPKPPLNCIRMIGDRVVYGAWDWTAVLDVLDDHKILKVMSVTRHTKRNVPDATAFQIHYLAWYDVNEYRTDEVEFENESLVAHEDVRLSYQQRDAVSLIGHMCGQYGIDMNPEYQRGNVWTLEQKVALIDSIFNNVDIGKFTVIRRKWGTCPDKPDTPFLYEMLDGKQRATAIFEYFMGRFAYKGKYYNDLCHLDRHHVKYYSISYSEAEPMTDKQKYRYFIKLNTTGTPVDPEHMNKVAAMLKDKEK